MTEKGDFYLTDKEIKQFVSNFNKDCAKNLKKLRKKTKSLRVVPQWKRQQILR